eukprot:bmy_19154T0
MCVCSLKFQVGVIDALIDLNEQLLQSPFPNSSNLSSRMPVTVCLFHSLNNITKTSEASRQRPKDDTEQVENTLKMSLLTLRRIQEAFLQQNWYSESAVTLTSFAATLLLSRQNISTLPLSSYTFSSPAPLRLGFPSASVLEQLLNKHPGVNIQIVLWRNASTGTHPTNLNVSADYFTITVNVTSLQKSLIVCVEPESPLSMTLYLGFQHQPNHTHFHPNVSLPKERYTWVLTPESLQYGVGTYYIKPLLNRSKEGAQQMPALFSVVTAVTQCYFWDSGNSTWGSSDARAAKAAAVHPPVSSWRMQGSILSEDLLVFLVRVTVLADNDPSSQFHYLIEVSTGCRRRAATTANVVITLYGSEGQSEPHHLCDSQKAVFERGGLDVFLLGTPSSLRELHSLQLWHDSSGTPVLLHDCRKFHPGLSVALSHSLTSLEPVYKSPASHLLHDPPSLQHGHLCRVLEDERHHHQETIQTAVILFPVSLGIGRLFPLIQPQEPLPLFPPIQASCLSDASFEPLSLTEIVEVNVMLPPPCSGKGMKGNCGIPAQEKYVPTLSVNSLHGVLSYNINQLVKLLSSLVCSYLEGQGRHQWAGPYRANVSTWNVLSVVPENHHHFHSYLLRVLWRLQSHLGTLGPAQAHQPCDFLDAVSQLQKLQELLETCILPPEQGPSSLASAFFTALYSLELNKDQATSCVISVLSLLQNMFITSKGDLPHIVLLTAAEQDAVASQREGTSNQEDLGSLGCPSSLPGSRDENNPIYVAPAMNGPFNLLCEWSISDYRTFLSSAVTAVGLLMGISHHKEVIALNPVLGSFLILLTSVVLMVLVIINLFVSAILMAFGKERKSFKQQFRFPCFSLFVFQQTQKEAALMDMLLLKLSSLLGKQQHQNTYSSVYGTWHYQRVNTAGVVQDKPALLPNKHHVTSFMFQEDCGKYESEGNTALKIKQKGHRGLPENPVELRGLQLSKVCNWIQVEQCPAARSSVYVNEKTQLLRIVTMASWAIFSLSHSYQSEKIHNLALNLTHHQSLCTEGFVSKSRTSAQS